MRWLARLRAKLRGLNPIVIDVAWAGALYAFMVWLLVSEQPRDGQRATTFVAYLLAFVLTAPLAWHRRYPLAALAICVTGLLGYAALHYSAFPGLALFALLFGITLHSDYRRALVALAVSLSAIALALAQQPAGIVTSSTWIASTLSILIVWLAASNQRNRRARWNAMEERALLLERDREEQARRAVASERLRIARELHDVVAHSMSVIAVQSGVGNHVIRTDPEAAQRALATIQSTSRAALIEMRQLLGVLRQDGEPASASLEPAPGLADLPDLVAGVRDAGLAVSLDVDGVPAELPLGVDTSAYRLVQEALTNVLKHGGPKASVTICQGPEELSIEVVDDGRNAPHGATVPDSTGAGHGLIGMRERVAVFGGDFTAGRRPGGGYRVSARLPYAANKQ